MSGTQLVIAGSPGALADHVARIAAAAGTDVVHATKGAKYGADADVWFFGDDIDASAQSFRDARSFNLVLTPYCGNDVWRWLRGSGEALAQPPFCTRVFTTSWTVNRDGRSREGFHYVLGALFDLKTEIGERVETYFDHRALRIHAPADARVNLIASEKAAELMLAIAARADRGHWTIASPESDALGDVLERVSAALGIGLLAEEDGAWLNAIDELLDIRLCRFQQHLGSPVRELVEESCILAEIDPSTLIVDADAQCALFDEAVAEARADRQAFLDRSASYPASLDRVELARDDAPFVYYVAGSGPHAIVLLNAFGQTLDFWFRLIEQLRERYKILIAETSDTLSARNRDVASFAEDVDSMLRREGADHCHMVAWCTGPRIAVEYALRHPERVRSLVFLNTSLRCTGGPPELCSAYENNFDLLRRMLEQRPSMAASMMASLQASAGNDDGIEDLLEDPEADVAARVLSRINRRLRSPVAAPFASTESFLQYTRGVDAFWSYDIREKAAAIELPVLLLSAEHDQVVVPAGSTVAAALFPRGRHVHVPGATHYFLYDRPEVTAAVITTFLDDPDAVGEPVYSLSTQESQAVIP